MQFTVGVVLFSIVQVAHAGCADPDAKEVLCVNCDFEQVPPPPPRVYDALHAGLIMRMHQKDAVGGQADATPQPTDNLPFYFVRHSFFLLFVIQLLGKGRDLC
jgi:hypothetical protein